MGEVLSQSEIDSLLAALSTGELDAEEISKKDEKQVRNYDFARPATEVNVIWIRERQVLQRAFTYIRDYI